MNDNCTNCTNCGKRFTVGFDGMANGLCDSCAGIERDANGYAWEAGETCQVYEDLETGEISSVTRDRAFRRRNN